MLPAVLNNTSKQEDLLLDNFHLKMCLMYAGLLLLKPCAAAGSMTQIAGMKRFMPPPQYDRTYKCFHF